VTLCRDQDHEDGSVTERLLGDIQVAFGGDTERLASADLCDLLGAIEDAPWGDWYGKPLDSRTLARLLKHHRIRPKQFWIDGINKRGYERAQFEDAFTRYLAARTAESLDALSNNGNGPSGLTDLAASEPDPGDVADAFIDTFAATIEQVVAT
jgi:hypothetical protein